MGQLKLTELLKEIKRVSYTKPNFDFEWEFEAKRYPEFIEMGKEAWIELAEAGKAIRYSSIEDKLGNVDLNFDELNPDRKGRFEAAFEEGIIEMPLAVKNANTELEYDLIGGNTRLAGLVKNGIDPKIWVVNYRKKKEDEKMVARRQRA